MYKDSYSRCGPGGVLSPPCWNFVFDDLLKALNQGPFTAFGFADDGLIFIIGIDPNAMISLMQGTVAHAIEWGNQNGLTFSPAKTVAMLFSRKNKVPKLRKSLRLGNTPIPMVNSVKYLGATLDKHLNWTEHINQKVNKPWPGPGGCRKCLTLCSFSF